MTQDITPQEAMKRLEQYFGSREGMLTHTLTIVDIGVADRRHILPTKADIRRPRQHEARSRTTITSYADGSRPSGTCLLICCLLAR